MFSKHHLPSPRQTLSDISLGLQPNTGPRDGHKRIKDILVMFLLSLLIIAVFGKTIFAGESISRVCQLAERDSFYSMFRTGNQQPYDCSIYQSLVPYFYLVTNSWHSGQLPLWNPYCGAGEPLAGDILTTAFAPLRILSSISPSLAMYNFLLVLQAVVSIIGMYLLSRGLGLNRYAASFASTAYVLCPYLLFSLELTGTSTCLFPLLFWLFVRMAKCPSVTNSALAGIGCTVLILSGHPELSFFGICFASLLASLLMIFTPSSSKLSSRLLAVVRSLTLAGLVTFCLSAPVLLPFAEYMTHSDCFKASLTGHKYCVSWQAILYNLCQPGFKGGSPFLGFVASLFFVAALVLTPRTDRTTKCLLLLSVLCLSIVCRLGPMDNIFDVKPFSWFMTEYCLPIFLLFAAVISAFGLEHYLAVRDRRKQLLVPIATMLLLLYVPLAIRAFHVPITQVDLNDYLKQMSVNTHWLYKDIILSAIFLCLCFLPKNPRWTTFIGCAFIGLNLTSIAPIVKSAAPSQPRFEYAEANPLPFLQQSGARMLNMGRHTFCPSTNIVYRIANLVSPNVQYPSRTVQFMKSAGITVEGINQFFDSKLTRLIDLASVRYILSQQPVDCAEDLENGWLSQPVSQASGNMPADGFELRPMQLRYDTHNHQMLATVEWKVNRQVANQCYYSPLISDEHGQALWLGDSQPLVRDEKTAQDAQHISTVRAEIPLLIPISIKDGQQLVAGVQILDYKTSALHRNSPAENELATIFPIARFRALSSTGTKQTTAPHFNLLSETSVNQIRLYENRQALPPAYLVNRCIAASSESDALEKITSSNFDPHQAVVLEGIAHKSPRTQPTASDPKLSVVCHRPNQNQVTIDVTSNQPGWLVLTDTFYPGWTASVDRKPATIYRANYLFRSVEVPEGRHQVMFSYQPISFAIGVVLAILCTLGLGLGFLKLRYSQNRA